MKTEKFIERERKSFNKMLNFRLPYLFKIVGVIVFIIALLLLIFRSQFGGELLMLKNIARQGIVIGLLFISLSRDKEEDEMTIHLRARSYAFAFVVGVLYALTMPYVEYGVANVIKPESTAFKNLGEFQLLSFMLLVQVMFYNVLKRFR